MTAVPIATPKLRSYTAMTTYMECPLQYRLKYVEKMRDDPAVWNIGGTAFHTCAEWLLLDHEEAKAPTDGMWLAAWHQAKEEVFERNPNADHDVSTWRAANGGREGVDWWMKNGPEMVDRFAHWRKTKGQSLVVLDQGVEHRFEVELGGVPVVAIPDALVVDEHGQLNILDWKSGRRAPSGALQLAVYRTAVLNGWGLDAVWGHFYLTRKAVLIPYDLTTWQPEYIEGLFQQFDSRERAGQYPPTPGDHCKFCVATRDQCTYGKETK